MPSLREGCLGASTSALRELVKRYPMMAFHQGTQRLAVGTTDGVVLIYDLRTATKWRILQVTRPRPHDVTLPCACLILVTTPPLSTAGTRAACERACLLAVGRARRLARR